MARLGESQNGWSCLRCPAIDFGWGPNTSLTYRWAKHRWRLFGCFQRLVLYRHSTPTSYVRPGSGSVMIKWDSLAAFLRRADRTVARLAAIITFVQNLTNKHYCTVVVCSLVGWVGCNNTCRSNCCILLLNFISHLYVPLFKCFQLETALILIIKYLRKNFNQ